MTGTLPHRMAVVDFETVPALRLLLRASVFAVSKGKAPGLIPLTNQRDCKKLKIMVGERGFEPPTTWSRTRFQHLLNSIEFCRSQVIGVEPVAALPWRVVALC